MSMRSIIICLYALLPMNGFGFIYHTQVLRRWMPEANTYQYVIGLSDYHDKQHYANNNQRAQLEQLLRSCNIHKAKVLVEDLSSRNNVGRQMCGNFMVDSRGGILGGLGATCKKISLPVTNVEYRYCRVAAFGPVLNALKTINLSSVRPANQIRIQAINDEIMHEINHIKTYATDPVLRPVYAQSVTNVLKKMHELQLDTYQRVSVAEYIEKLSKPNDRVKMLTQLLTFDSVLLDLKMVHDILQSQNKNTIIAIAGGSHIKNVSELLKKIGYQDVYASPITQANEYNLQKCLGSHIINGSYCVKPKAIDLNEVKQFLIGN